MDATILDAVGAAVIPVVTAVLGWVGNAYRNKQAKERDIMANVKEMMGIQNDFIAGLKANIDERDASLNEIKRINHRLETKLDQRDRAIRKANFCRFTSEGDGCPVLMQDEPDHPFYKELCDKCEHRDDTDKNQNW